MPAKKGPEPEASPSPQPTEPPADVPEPEVSKRCFRTVGQVYYGDCRTSGDAGFMRHGLGRQVSIAKNVAGEDVVVGSYEGSWENDVMEGHGSYRWPDGSTYEGAFHRGDIHGFGRYEWPEGSAYDGCWVRGLMTGQGRFDSRIDGEFLVGKFYRDWHQTHDGRWVNVRAEHARTEQRQIREGDAGDVAIVRCPGLESLAATLQAVHEESLVPFLVSDVSLTEATSALAADLLDLNSTASVRDAAKRRQRLADFRRPFFGAMQAALLSGSWLAVFFEDEALSACAGRANAAGRRPVSPEVAADSLPDGWRLEHFFGDMSLPIEVFHPKLFNGRARGVPFLPTELQDEFHASMVAAAGGLLPSASDGGAGGGPPVLDAVTSEAGDSVGHAEDDGSPKSIASLRVQPTPLNVHHLRCMLVASAKLPAGLSDDDVRQYMLTRYGKHVPMHRTSVVLLTVMTDEAEA